MSVEERLMTEDAAHETSAAIYKIAADVATEYVTTALKHAMVSEDSTINETELEDGDVLIEEDIPEEISTEKIADG